MKKSIFYLIACAVCLCTTTSCASIFCGSKAKVTFDSNVKEGVCLTIDGIKYNDVVFPFTTKVKRGFDDTIVRAEAENYFLENAGYDLQNSAEQEKDGGQDDGPNEQDKQTSRTSAT